MNPQWFAWRPGDLQIECFEGQPLFLKGECPEVLAHPVTIVNQALTVLQYLLSFALRPLALCLLCEKTLPPELNLRFIPLKLFQVNHLGRIGVCPALFLPVTSPQGRRDGLSFLTIISLDTRPPLPRGQSNADFPLTQRHAGY